MINDAKRSICFGVAFRLLSAFAAITIFAIATSVIALYTFGKYGDGFNRIASTNVPALVAASNLAQRSQALAANAPNLAVADGHFARRAVSEGLRGQLQAIAEASEQVKTLAPTTEGLDSLIQNQASLGGKLEKLDALVAEKLETDRVAANLMLRLRALSVRIQAVGSNLLSKLTGEQASRAQTDALSAWIAAADHAIVIMLSTSSADTTIRLNQLRSEFEDVRKRAQTASGQLSAALFEEVNPLDQTLVQYGSGSPNIFDVRTAQLASASAVRGGLLDTKDTAAQFVASAEGIFTDIQRDVRAQSNFFGGLISKYSRLFAILSLLCVAGACGIFLYINRSIIRRLRIVSESMRGSVEGHTTTISISGNDEIADMAKAADFFVTSIEQREKGLRDSLQQQTATADVLKVISRSTFDLRTVLQTLVESAARFCDADKATITREKDGAFYRTEAYGFSREFMDYAKDVPIVAERGSAAGRALLEGRVIHIPDVKADPEYTLVEAQRLGDYRTILCVPMLREGIPIGVLILTRSEVRPFTDKQVELVTTFADQAAIAIENVRLFESVEARTRELAASLEDLRTTQDRLVQTQKLASLGQLTAGIAHEIKNPLNFVNNFSVVSSELIDELRDTVKGLPLDDKARAEINELTDTLRGNLDKVVQHGKRADAIVNNMLLHSREGSGEHRPVDINAIVEESLNLAYHGARAEKQGFNITLQRSLDPAAGEVDVFPQDITRVLLNLISNGFYAATKRKAGANGGNYEPTLTAATKNLGDRVEIRIRDNGTGISPEVKAKLFNPFFTTKPAGEGTGLGLSISHDIIVKQHGGSIEVDTQPGEFTELRIILPRAAVFQSTVP